MPRAAARSTLTSDHLSADLLLTKLYVPPTRPDSVARPRLIEQLNAGLAAGHKLTLISAPAGFGKTTLVSQWVATCERPVAWLSLDEGDNDPTRFLAYLVAALQTIGANIGEGMLGRLQSPQPPPTEAILTALLNEIAAVQDDFVLVLDDYHGIDTKATTTAHAFLLEHLPPQMHLVIATREDPHLPLARLRARGQLTELRAGDLRFTPAEAADLLNQVMGLNLSAEDLAALETRTEGWIAGLQLAAISMQGHQDATSFIQSFTGSHRFILDYLVEEVLQQQSESVQTFLLRTSILDRLCGPLCDAVCSCETDVVQKDADLPPTPSASGEATLEYLERVNLFIVPLDDERRWFRYHHLFADLLRQRLHQSFSLPPSDTGKALAELHVRASQWFEDHGLELEAFHHAAAANDIERAERLIEGKGMPRHSRSAVNSMLNWLGSLPRQALDARPSLWWRYAALLLVMGQLTGVEEKLQAAEAALEGAAPDAKSRDLIGQIAEARAVLALAHYQVEPMLVQSRRALEYLHPNNLARRATANWTLGFAYFNQGDREAARRAMTEAVSLSEASGDIFTTILATTGLGQGQEVENQLYRAAETYQRVLQLAGDQPLQVISEAHLGLGRVLYEWNDLDAAEQHGQQGLKLSQQYDRAIDRFIIYEVFLARLKLAREDVAGAAALLARADQSARLNNYVLRMPEVAAAQVLTLLRQGDVPAAAYLAQAHTLPLSQARVHLAQGDPSSALAVLVSYRRQMEAKRWQDERLRAMVLQAVALHVRGDQDQAVQLVGEALALAEPGGFIRLFADEGMPMAQLLSKAAARGLAPGYTSKLLAAYKDATKDGGQMTKDSSFGVGRSSLVEPLSQRELEILQLIAQGLSNEAIGDRLFLALSTVKGHNRNIFDKLQVKSRTEAVARARELGLY